MAHPAMQDLPPAPVARALECKQKLDGSIVVSGGFSGRPVSDDPEGQAEEILDRAKELIPEAEGS